MHRKGLSPHPGLQLPLDTRHSTSRNKGHADPAVDGNLPLRARTKIPGPLPKCLAPPSTLSTRGYTLENVAGPSSPHPVLFQTVLEYFGIFSSISNKSLLVRQYHITVPQGLHSDNTEIEFIYRTCAAFVISKANFKSLSPFFIYLRFC